MCQMECEVKSLKRELEGTREALRLQTMRCRQLAAAFTTRLREKEAELQTDRRVKDQQLSRVVRALVILEARLRREQRTIREQLYQKDTIIRNQQIEIMRLRRSQNHRSSRNDKKEIGTSVQSLRINEVPEEEEKCQEEFDVRRTFDMPKCIFSERRNGSNFEDVSSNSESITDSSESITNSSESGAKDENQGNSSLEHIKDSDLHDEGVIMKRPEFRRSQSASVIRFKKNAQSRIHTHRIFRSLSKSDESAWAEKVYSKDRIEKYSELKKLASTLSQELDGQTEDDCSPDHEEGLSRDLSKDYQHNPVLECVSQILLRDQDGDDEDILPHEEHVKPSNTTEENKNFEMTDENFDNVEYESLSSVNGFETESDCKEDTYTKLSWVKDTNNSHPERAHNMEEKGHSPMQSQGFEESGDPIPSKTTTFINRNQIPPALPPKPPQLGSLLLRKKKMPSPQSQQNGQQLRLQEKDSGNCETRDDIKRNNCKANQDDCSDSYNSNHYNKSDDSILHAHQNGIEKPRHRQILSNGSLRVALNNESIAEQSDSSKSNNNNILECDKNGYLSFQNFKEKFSSLLPHKKSNNHTSKDNNNHNTQNHTLKQASAKLSNLDHHNSLTKTPPCNANCNAIKIGSSVSSLITGSSGQSIITELTQEETSPGIHVSALVKHFEVLQSSDKEILEEDGNEALRRNFEEFKLEDVDMDSMEDMREDIKDCEEQANMKTTEENKERSEEESESNLDEKRPEADGAETRNVHIHVVDNSETYEHFLESTGLSQKSILTPSRMFSNHRNVLKPKDVKHRSKILKAQSVVNNNANGPVVKYWMEPFL